MRSIPQNSMEYAAGAVLRNGMCEYSIGTVTGSSFAGAWSLSAYPMSNSRFILSDVINSPLPSTSTSVGTMVTRRSAAVESVVLLLPAAFLSTLTVSSTGTFRRSNNCVDESPVLTIQSSLAVVKPGARTS